MRRIWWLVALALPGCSGLGPSIEFILPPDFVGPFWLVLDPDEPELPLMDGRIRVVVPANRVLQIRSFQPFEQWQEQFARYADGASVPTLNAADNAVALRGGGVTSQGDGDEKRVWVRYFVGTADQLSARPWLDPPPEAGREGAVPAAKPDNSR